MWVIFSPFPTLAPAKEEQLIDEKPCPETTSEGPVGHMQEGHLSPVETVVTQGSVEPVPLVGQERTPPPKPPRLHKPLKISEPILELGGHIPATGSNDVETKEAEPKGENVEEVGVGWWVEVQVSLQGGVGVRHTGRTHRGCPGMKARITPPIC